MGTYKARCAKVPTGAAGCLPSLPALPTLAQYGILVHCTSSDLAALRTVSRDHRQLVDDAVTRLFPWIVASPAAPAPSATTVAQIGTSTGRAGLPVENSRGGLCRSDDSGQTPNLYSTRQTLTTDASVQLNFTTSAPIFKSGTNNSSSNTANTSDPYSSLCELILRHHPHLDHALDPSTAAFEGDGGQLNHGGGFGPPHQPMHMPCRLRHGMSDLASMPELTSLNANMLCLVDAAAAREAARRDLDQPAHQATAWRCAGVTLREPLSPQPPLRRTAPGAATGAADAAADAAGGAAPASNNSPPAAAAASSATCDGSNMSDLDCGDDCEDGAGSGGAGGGSRAAAQAAQLYRARLAWVKEMNALRLYHYRQMQLVRLRDVRLEEQIAAAVQRLPLLLAPRLTQLTLTEVPFSTDTFSAVAACGGLTRLVLSARTDGGRGAAAGGGISWSPSNAAGGAAAAAAATAANRRAGELSSEHLTCLAAGLKQLRHLDLHAKSFAPDANFSPLAALTRLSYVRLNQSASYDIKYGGRFERVPADYCRQALLGPLEGLEGLAGLPQLHSLGLTGLDCPPKALLEAFPYGGGPLRQLALRKVYRITGGQLEAVGRLTALTELQLSADWCLHPGSDSPAPLQPPDLLAAVGDPLVAGMLPDLMDDVEVQGEEDMQGEEG
ncbi:hypothetical protein Agub_g8293, partial [Astrephomene gubernaculifera]